MIFWLGFKGGRMVNTKSGRQLLTRGEVVSWALGKTKTKNVNLSPTKLNEIVDNAVLNSFNESRTPSVENLVKRADEILPTPTPKPVSNKKLKTMMKERN